MKEQINTPTRTTTQTNSAVCELEQIKEMARVLEFVCDLQDEDSCISECDTCRATALYNAGYRKQSEWISVDDRMPPENCRVLVYSPTDGINLGHRLDEVGRFYVTKPYPDHPTHWMPLPQLPEMKGGAE